VKSSPGQLPVNRLLSFLLALVAGSITWGFIHTQDPFFKVAERYHIRGLGESDERWNAYLEQQSRVDFMNAALVIGILGGALGLTFAVCRPTRVSIHWRLLMGIVFGMLVGVVAGVAGDSIQQHFAGSRQLSVVESAYINATLFGLLGLGLGAIAGGMGGFGWAILDRAVAGLIAGAIAGILYPVVGFVALDSANIEAFIPRMTMTRLLWLGMGTGFLGLLIPSSVSENNPTSLETAETKATKSCIVL